MSEQKTCPQCGEACERDMVDVGIGEIPSGPWGCPNCYWVEKADDTRFDAERKADDDYFRSGTRYPGQ